MWKKFYPHETFVKLIKSTVRVLERKDKLNIWVDGAYGTGKSHAVLTLKRLLDADEGNTREYFRKYGLDNDLCNCFQAVKNEGKILTVHRYGSASIHGDHNLVFAVQESVEKALADAGIENKGGSALKDATVKWLSDRDNRAYFNSLITGAYSDLFGGDNVDDVTKKLNSYTGDALTKIMDKIFKVADERQIRALSMSISSLADWIREVIKVNKLKSIVFIWDEFSEYFNNNARNLSGFQELCEISETDPFCFIIVAHMPEAHYNEKDPEIKKLLGRFVAPQCRIELPENIAFQLMGAAMEKNEDEAVAAEWADTLEDLTDRTRESRKLVGSCTTITDNEMKNILPIHPYAAYVLKHISSTFDSNQRSMFDFIKNDRGDEIKGFQWFIDNHGPLDENPLLTVDMLWEFFYDKGKENLSHDVRLILDYFHRAGNQRLDSEQKRVLKTVLILQAMSQKMGGDVELLIPNEKNIEYAFEGTDLQYHAERCADMLVREKILFKKSLGGGKFQYAAYSSEVDMDTSSFEEEIDKKKTTALVTEELTDKTKVADAVSPGGALKLRYELRYVSVDDFDYTVRNLRNTEENYANKIISVVCFAKDDRESVAVGKKIAKTIEDGACDYVFIDATRTPFGADGYGAYRHDMALSMANQKNDKSLANQYAENAKDTLKKWKIRIEAGEFVVYTANKPDGDRAANIDDLYDKLIEIDKKKFPECLEGTYTVIGNMYTASNLRQGVESACLQKTRGTYLSGSPATKLENALEGAWQTENYWEKNPYLHISKLKNRVNDIIDEGFKDSGRVSIRSIYDDLRGAPYGFMPCNFSAFILGFVLKEYTNGVYSWSDGLTNDVLDVNKLKEMIDEVIHLDITPNARYKEKYIVAFTPEEKAFNEAASTAFGIPLKMCTNVTNTRELIRSKMKDLSFPIWTLKSVLNSEALRTDKSVLEKMIDYFVGIANSSNLDGTKTDNDIAMEIGKMSIKYPEASWDLKSLFNREKCTEGMIAYLKMFDGGELISLAETISDGGKYINEVRKKFDADAANWVWSRETAQQKIREVILEYQIIAESNKISSKCITYEETIREWRDKCQYIRISYDAGKNYFDDIGIGAFLRMLYSLKKSGTLSESQKENFLQLLRMNGEDFRNFYNNQAEMFKKICSYYLDDLSEENIQNVLKSIPHGSFMYEKSEYLSMVEKHVQEYRNSLKSAGLKKLWRERTHSDSPKAWSEQHKMPITCLVPDNELIKAKAAFRAVNLKSPDSDSVDKAMEYFESAEFFALLDNEDALDKAFSKRLIKNYAVILTDIQEVKDYLDRRISAEPYEWLGLPEVENRLREMAEAKYNREGCKTALEKIDKMDAADAKRYLKDLIQDNMVVGLEIIKEN
ncbi:MAG: hypothetical protein LUH40_08585 [Clostridiales bacterium]|nr:hypothetical protein [Clostridiales bacterium]